MTNEQKQAIDILKQRECCRECVVDSGDCDACDEAFKMAIEAISATDVIERAKIDKAIEELQHIKIYDHTRTARLVSLPEVLDVFKRNIGG